MGGGGHDAWYLEEVVHHLGAEAGGDGGGVLQAGAAVHLYQPHIQGLVHHKVVPEQLMAVGPCLQALLHTTPPPLTPITHPRTLEAGQALGLIRY